MFYFQIFVVPPGEARLLTANETWVENKTYTAKRRQDNLNLIIDGQWMDRTSKDMKTHTSYKYRPLWNIMGHFYAAVFPTITL